MNNGRIIEHKIDVLGPYYDVTVTITHTDDTESIEALEAHLNFWDHLYKVTPQLKEDELKYRGFMPRNEFRKLLKFCRAIKRGSFDHGENVSKDFRVDIVGHANPVILMEIENINNNVWKKN